MEGEGNISNSNYKRDVVTAALTSPIEEHELPLSNLDILLPPDDFSIFLCYKTSTNDVEYTFSKVISILKEALSISLVSFYILAGELSKNGDVVLCNNRGVDFVEAFVDVNLKDIDFYNSHQSVDGILIPQRNLGLLAIQVTRLKCGGFVISCTFDHRVSDGYSANMFLLSWVKIAKSKSQLSCVPSFDRSILSPRKSPSFDMFIVNTVFPETLPPLGDSHSDGMDSTHQAGKFISRIYYMKADDITELHSQANVSNEKSCGNMKITRLEAFCAFLWKLISNGELTSNDKSCKMGIVVDGRNKIINENEANLWYFGNVLSIPFGEMKTEELKKKPINLVADSIQEFLKPAITREHFLGLVDYIEAHKPRKTMAKIYATEVGNGEAAIVVSSGLKFSAQKIDFGWGLPMFGSCYYSWKGKAGYVMPMLSARGDGDWIVFMHMLKRQLEWIENCAGGVLNPLTSEYLFKE